jgi:glycerol-3-phosphate acyltransferase PlsY
MAAPDGVPLMLELGIKLLASYLLGSVIGSLVVGRFRGGVDIRKFGSGNAGGTNALRTQGRVFAFWVMVIDVLKGVLPVLVLPGLALPGISPEPALPREWVAYACGFAAVLGHVWPVWYEFRGGKGAATAVGVFAALEPVLVLPLLVVWIGVIVVTGYVGLGTMLAAATAAIVVAVRHAGSDPAFVLFAFALAGLIVYTHRSNVARLRAGTEHRVEKAMLFRRRSTGS